MSILKIDLLDIPLMGSWLGSSGLLKLFKINYYTGPYRNIKHTIRIFSFSCGLQSYFWKYSAAFNMKSQAYTILRIY